MEQYSRGQLHYLKREKIKTAKKDVIVRYIFRKELLKNTFSQENDPGLVKSLPVG